MGMIEVEGVLGRDEPVVGGDAGVVGAKGEAAVAQGAAKHGLAAAGEAAVELAGIGGEVGTDFFPGI
jgi:hypothetical protein